MVLKKPRLFPPGEGWAYRGSNYIVLRLVVEATTGVPLRDVLRQRVFSPLGLQNTDPVEGPLRGDCAHGYLAPDNQILPGGPDPVDVTGIDVPFHRAGGGIVSTAAEVATLLRAEMLDAIESDWAETDRYGLGIGEITSVMGRQRSSCGAAWGHVGFSVGYMAIALSSEDGVRQAVICVNGHPADEAADEFLNAAGRLAWDLYCS